MPFSKEVALRERGIGASSQKVPLGSKDKGHSQLVIRLVVGVSFGGGGPRPGAHWNALKTREY